MLPYWFRFAQCLKKFYETRMRAHLLNAGKYFVSLMIPIFSTLHNHADFLSLYVLFLGVSAIGAMYSYVWDIYMDWGLMRTTMKGHFMLREKILYPSYFYYIAMAADLILRFAWLVSLYPASLISKFWGVYF